MTSFYELYRKFPNIDCGYCGNASCVTALRRYLMGKFSLDECLYFKKQIYNKGDFMEKPARKASPFPPGIRYISPCPSDSSMVTAEVSLNSSPDQIDYFDFIIAEKIFGYNCGVMKISPTLGIARFEVDGKAVMAFSDGRVLVRRALDKK
ncbi:MAG: hypothetical protein NO516_05165, partial [Candidatus Methanomethylicia archaeon]|nr:hypothetical protein [Candidatus Methanomethylicia archaeon]